MDELSNWIALEQWSLIAPWVIAVVLVIIAKLVWDARDCLRSIDESLRQLPAVREHDTRQRRVNQPG